jgi:twitching motility protein PilT
MLAASRAALREEPDVLVIDELGSGDLAQLALDAALQARLVVVSIDAPTAAAALQRFVELVPAEQRPSACAALARCFRGAIAQLLLRKAAGGRVAARELLVATRALTRVLAEGDLSRLDAELEAARAAGMTSLVDALVDYVRAGVVDVREAFRKAPDPERLLAGLTAASVDVSAIAPWR